MRRFTTFAIIASFVALAALAAIAQEDATNQASPEEIAAAIEAIRAAETGPEAKSAYADISRRALESAELRQVYIQRVLELDRVDYGASAAEQLLKLVPDDLNALRVAAYSRAKKDDLAGALDASLQAGVRATNDEATMKNLGQLVAYMQLNDEAPDISESTLELLNQSTEALAGIEAYATEHDRIAQAYGIYLAGLEEVALALADLSAAKEAQEAKLAELEAQLETILENKREIQKQIRSQGGGGAGGASGQQQVPPELQEVQNQEMQCRADIKTAENEIKKLARQVREAEDDFEDYTKKKSSIIRREGGLLEFSKPVALAQAPTALTGVTLPETEPENQPEAQPAPTQPEPETPDTDGNNVDAAADDGELLLDNDANGDMLVAQGQEFWMLDNSLPDLMGETFLHDNNTGKGQAQIGLMFTPAQAGSYKVMAYCPAFDQAATNVPVEIYHAQGTATVTYDQRNGGGTWVDLGIYTFGTDEAGAVLFKNEGTDGYVMFDAIKLVPAEAPVIVGQPISLPAQE